MLHCAQCSEPNLEKRAKQRTETEIDALMTVVMMVPCRLPQNWGQIFNLISGKLNPIFATRTMEEKAEEDFHSSGGDDDDQLNDIEDGRANKVPKKKWKRIRNGLPRFQSGAARWMRNGMVEQFKSAECIIHYTGTGLCISGGEKQCLVWEVGNRNRMFLRTSGSSRCSI